jgi:hypothetical protein
MTKMTDCNYAATQNALIQAGRLLDSLDLNAFRRRLSLAQSAGLVSDPSLFRKVQKRMEILDRMAELGVEMSAQVRTLRALVEAEESARAERG